MHFSRKKCLVAPHEYYLNQQRIRSTVSQCDLGILVSDDLKWSLHINNLVSKGNRMLGFLRRNCFHLADVNARRLLYYCCLLFALIYLMVPKFGRLKYLHLTCIVLKVSSVAPPNFYRIFLPQN